MRNRTRRIGIVAALATMGAVAAAAALGTTFTGPSSSASPYVVPTATGVTTKSILTVGDSVGDYRLVGIPDGLGAFDNGNGTFTLLANHEIPAGRGTTRAHGANGAFVSKWTIDKRSLRVLKGQDLIQQIALWTGTAYAPAAKGIALARLCSANLAAQSAFYNSFTHKGYPGRLFLSGEESGVEGRPFAHDLTGTSWELGYLGNASWENLVANPFTFDKTVVVSLDDTTPGQVYVYIGDKRRSGNPVERAGLVGGKLYGIKVVGYPVEPAAGIPSGTKFELVEIKDAQLKTGAQIEAEGRLAGVTDFNRPEDGQWNPRDARDFYWVTTASFGGTSRLWRLNFNPLNLINPKFGGTIDMLLDGTEGQEMLDNLTVDDNGRVLIQEDVGNNARLGKLWSYSIAGDTLTEIAQHDPDRFLTGAPNFITQDEESSGIIEADFLGEGWYLLDVQAHFTQSDPELVEGGQLLALHLPPSRR